jgi:zinc transporter ZupT
MGPVIRSEPGALWLLHLLMASFTSVVENGVIGSVLGHALSRNVLTVFSVVLLLVAGGMLYMVVRYVATAAAFSLSDMLQVPSSCRSGGT